MSEISFPTLNDMYKLSHAFRVENSIQRSYYCDQFLTLFQGDML